MLRSAIAALLIGAFAAAGCASLTPQECLSADWQAIGYEDGAAGRGLDTLGKHRRACAEVGVTPDLAAYEAGRQRGLRTFCRPENAYRLGREGYAYAGVCPEDLEPDFMYALNEGLFVHRLETDVAATESEIAWVDDAIAEHAQEIDEAERALARDELADGERRRLRQSIRGLARRIGQLEGERDALTAELIEREVRLLRHLEGR